MTHLSTKLQSVEHNINFDDCLDIINENSSSSTPFADETDFVLLHEIKACPFRELPCNVIYHIQHIKKIRKHNGQDSILLYLYSKDSSIPVVCWGTFLLTTELLAMSDFTNIYIKSTGIKKSISTGRDYYGYQLVQKR